HVSRHRLLLLGEFLALPELSFFCRDPVLDVLELRLKARELPFAARGLLLRGLDVGEYVLEFLLLRIDASPRLLGLYLAPFDVPSHRFKILLPFRDRALSICA